MSRYLVIAPDGVTVANVIVAEPARVPELAAAGLVLVLDLAAPTMPIGPGDEVDTSGPEPVITKPAPPSPADALVIDGEKYELKDKGGEFVLVKMA